MKEQALGFNEVRELRQIYDRCNESQALCEGTGALLRGIRQVVHTSPKYRAASNLREHYNALLSSALGRQRGYLKGFQNLTKKLINTIELSAYAVDCEYQRTNANVSANVLKLTFLSLVYLPGSFVATLFGANFFMFDVQHKGLVMGSNIWILVVAWVLLTGITFIPYVLLLWWNHKHAKRSSSPLQCNTAMVHNWKAPLRTLGFSKPFCQVENELVSVEPLR